MGESPPPFPVLSTFDLENSIEGQCSVCVFGEGRKRDGGGGVEVYFTPSDKSPL